MLIDHTQQHKILMTKLHDQFSNIILILLLVVIHLAVIEELHGLQ